MRTLTLTLRDKFLLAFLTLAIILTGMFVLLASRISSILPDMSDAQTDRYAAQIKLRDMRDAITTAMIPNDLVLISSGALTLAHDLTAYQNEWSLTASPGAYQSLVFEEKSDLLHQEDRTIAAMSHSIRTFEDASKQGNPVQAREALVVFLGATKELERINHDAAGALKASAAASRRYLMTFSMIAVAILLLGILIVAQFLISWIAHPLEQMQRAAERIAAGDFSMELKAVSHDELGMLTKSFDEMRRKVLRSLNDVKSYAHREETLIKSIADGIVAVDHTGNIITFNDAIQTMTGQHADAVIGKPCRNVFGFAEDDVLHAMKLVMEQGVSQGVARPVIVRHETSQKETPVTMSIAPFLDESSRRGVVMVFHDIGEQQKLNELRDGFVSITSHQLRTPLTAIRWLLESLKKALAEGRMQLLSKDQQILEQAYERTLSMSQLVSSLLSLSRLESEAVKPTIKQTDLSVIFDQVRASLQEACVRKDVELAMHSDMMKQIETDPLLVTEILTNLVGNAVKYSHPHSKVVVRAHASDQQTVIEVHDEGIGITSDDQKSIFTKFFRSKNARSFTPDGTGIGLTLAKSFAELLRGSLTFTSDAKNGTSFFLSLPTS